LGSFACAESGVQRRPPVRTQKFQECADNRHHLLRALIALLSPAHRRHVVGAEIMSDKKPVPVMAGAHQNLCPVCGKRSYSAAGTHPQCALRQAEAVRKEQMAAEKTVEKKPPPKATRQQRSWNKTCPKCDAKVHVRKKICACGHNFCGL
jgi:hypothetical protein